MNKNVQLSHGGGGAMMRQLLEEHILTRLPPPATDRIVPDAAALTGIKGPLRFTTDAFVVSPLCFPGGNIGDLAVHGTVNDLAVSGARPRWMSLALIIEEGLPLNTLDTVLDSIATAASASGVQIVTGDTKVVPRGNADGIFICTSGVGEQLPAFTHNSNAIQAGDHLLISGPIADHGLAVLCAREKLMLDSGPVSDTASVFPLVDAIRKYGGEVRVMRDPTRGGLAAVCNEFAEEIGQDLLLEESAIPLSPLTSAAADLLGLDPLHVASEGRMLIICSSAAAPDILDIWRSLPEGQGAADIGTVEAGSGRVILNTVIGGRRMVRPPQGELLPRIC